jgi:hypothetical protein
VQGKSCGDERFFEQAQGSSQREKACLKGAVNHLKDSSPLRMTAVTPAFGGDLTKGTNNAKKRCQ